MDTRSRRRTLSGAILLAACVSSVLLLRGFSTPYAPSAPDYRTHGPADAPVQLAEFSDFQCPGCSASVEPLKRLQALYPGKIRFVFKHMPWPFHPSARKAAVAAECAGRTGGRFWDFHDALYARQAEWVKPEDGPSAFLRYAGEFGLDKKAFAACLEDPTAVAAVDADVKEAKERWVRSTPTFFVNGARFVGNKQLRTLALNRIEDILKR